MASPCWLVVGEGADDAELLGALAAARGITGVRAVAPANVRANLGGNSSFEQLLTALPTVRGFAQNVKGVLIVTDSDDNPGASFATVADQVRSTGLYAVPAAAYQVTTNPGKTPLAIAMVPDDGMTGALETLCLEAARSKWPAVAACVDAFVECAGTNAWPQNPLEKMKLRCFISATCIEDPNTPLSYLFHRAAACQLPLDHGAFDKLAKFLATLP